MSTWINSVQHTERHSISVMILFHWDHCPCACNRGTTTTVAATTLTREKKTKTTNTTMTNDGSTMVTSNVVTDAIYSETRSTCCVVPMSRLYRRRSASVFQLATVRATTTTGNVRSARKISENLCRYSRNGRYRGGGWRTRRSKKGMEPGK